MRTQPYGTPLLLAILLGACDSTVAPSELPDSAYIGDWKLNRVFTHDGPCTVPCTQFLAAYATVQFIEGTLTLSDDGEWSQTFLIRMNDEPAETVSMSALYRVVPHPHPAPPHAYPHLILVQRLAAAPLSIVGVDTASISSHTLSIGQKYTDNICFIGCVDGPVPGSMGLHYVRDIQQAR